MASVVDYLFVYGTLRRAIAAPMYQVIDEHCEYVADAWMQARLYEVKGYPGAIESVDSEDRVHGELYRMSTSSVVIEKLDEYEECADYFPRPHEYTRKEKVVFLPDGRSVVAWVYIYQHSVELLYCIQTGDYLQFVNRS